MYQRMTEYILNDLEIHVWKITLPLQKEVLEHIAQHLSLDEVYRIKNYHFESDKKRFMAARGGLRNILSRYTNIHPKNIDFSYTHHGKPYLSSRLLDFNTTHSADCILIAVTQHFSIG